jgi:hypothetical protein
LVNLKEEVSILQADSDYCTAQKKLTDSSYINAVNTLQEISFMHQNLQESLKYGSCIAEKGIQMNARKPIIDKLVFYSNLLTVKYDFLEKNKNLIVSHYATLTDDSFDTLVNIRKTLQTYNF